MSNATLERLSANFDRYGLADSKRTGSEGAAEIASWIAEELGRIGYAVERRHRDFDLPVDSFTVTAQGRTLHPIANPRAGADRAATTAPLARLDEAKGGDIAIAELPFNRWSEFEHPDIAARIAEARRRDVAVLLLATKGHSGEAVAINAPPNSEDLPFLFGTIGPAEGEWLVSLAMSGASAEIAIEPRSAPVSGEDIVAEIGDEGRHIVLSTPYTGWFCCAGERGPGIALFLELAASLSKAFPGQRLLAIATGAHELAEANLLRAVPPAEEIALWVHLGANAASRDFHETPSGLLPLSTPDPQRFLLVSEHLIERSRRCLGGLPGLADPYSISGRTLPGDAKYPLAHGVKSIIAILGAGRYHHSILDRGDMTTPEILGDTYDGLTLLINAALHDDREAGQ